MGCFLEGIRKEPPSAETLAKRLANLQNGRDEMNLCELPFATLSERNHGRNLLRYEVEDFDHQIGHLVTRSLTVKGDPEFGLPTEKDEEIYLGLLKYSHDYNSFADAEVRFSRSALFELMDWPKSDWAYARLTTGLHRLVGVRLSFQNFWRDNRNKQWRDQGAFAILDSFKLRDSRTVGRHYSFREQYSLFRWGTVLFQSFDSGYIKRIDYGLARSLSPTARRLYRYLDKHFHPPHKTRIVLDVAKLGYQHIGISSGVALDKVRKRHLGPAADELEQAGFLRACPDGRFLKVRRGVWEVAFEMARKRVAQGKATENQLERVVKALSRRGVSTATALTLASGYSVENIKDALRAMDEQLEAGNQIRSADQWFIAALKNGYKPSAAMQASLKRPELRVYRGIRDSK